MNSDPGQYKDVSDNYPEEYQSLLLAKKNWVDNVASELNEDVDRPFPIGHPQMANTQLPARDGIAHGNIVRSNRWPNCSYYLNWISTNDSITWNAEVLEDGNFELELYYTCKPENIGSKLQLKFNDNYLDYTLTEAFDSPLLKDDDVYPRGEGYVKRFNKVKMGTIFLKKGTGTLTLKANKIPGKEVMDFRLLMLKRV